MKPIVNSSFCQNLLVGQVSSGLHQNLLKQSFPFYNALLPVLTACCLTRGHIFEILSYQKLDNKKLATGTIMCQKSKPFRCYQKRPSPCFIKVEEHLLRDV